MLCLLLFLFIIPSIQSSAWPSFSYDHVILRLSARIEPESCNSTCSASCQDCINHQCQTSNNSCYIGNHCYEVNELYSNYSLSCLQCLPNKNQAQWSFNPECSAGPLCQNPQFIKINLCDNDTITSFYTDPTLAVSSSYNFEKCGQNSEACQAGFFSAQNLTQNLRNHYACCPGYFCPEGQLCFIPCRPGSYCPSELKAIDGTCKSPAPCQKNPSKTYERYGCGGSTFEGFCPPGSFCTTPRETELCSDNTIYCPTGVEKPLACPSHFVCLDGRARRQRLLTNVVIAVVVIIIIFVSGIEIFQWLALKKNLWGQKTFDDRSEVSDYFMERSKSKSKPTFQLNIHLYKARLRNVTRFDMKRNEGFTGRITAGRLTALMGGSGCG
ncbi:unnamed protein product, partial [Rotaria socialis]